MASIWTLKKTNGFILSKLQLHTATEMPADSKTLLQWGLTTKNQKQITENSKETKQWALGVKE